MLKFDKIIQTKTTEIVTIEPGTYFFKEVIDAEIYYRKYIVRENDWEA